MSEHNPPNVRSAIVAPQPRMDPYSRESLPRRRWVTIANATATGQDIFFPVDQVVEVRSSGDGCCLYLACGRQYELGISPQDMIRRIADVEQFIAGDVVDFQRHSDHVTENRPG